MRREHPQRDLASLGELEGIRQQVLENLPESLRIRLNLLRHARLHGPGEGQAILLGDGLKCLDERFHRSRRRNLLRREFHLPCLDPRQIQHIIDEREQIVARRGDGLGKFHLSRGQVAVLVVGQQLRENQGRVERGPQLMAHIR